MASSIIHICVAKKVNEFLNYDYKQLYLGTIAPDISKLVGETKQKSHFLTSIDSDIPDINAFLSKYKNNLKDEFVMGYLIHLYTDKIWFKEFILNKICNTNIKLLDGTIINADASEKTRLIYNDYTNLNIQLIDYYNLDLSLFYEEIPHPDNIIKEIPIDKLQIIIDKAGNIVMNSKEEKAYVFDIIDIVKFIDECTNKILEKIKNII